MNNLLLAFGLLLLSLSGIVVRKTYYQMPEKELKRRAARHDPIASELYRAVAYGSSTKLLLWVFSGLTGAGCIIILARELPIWISLLIVGPILWIVFSLVPATRVSSLGRKLALIATPLIAWLLSYLYPSLSRVADVVEGRYVINSHTKLYEREDLLELIERQQGLTDHRFSKEELEIAKRALQFDERSVGDILMPAKEVTIIKAGDTIGPVLIDELHKTEQEYALVRESHEGPFVGTLKVNQLGIKSTGHVRDTMLTTAYYLHENDSLSQALHAFYVTNRPVFIVVNSFEEFVGIISIENILHQLLGHIPGDDFDEYADLSAVASRHAKKKATAETVVTEDDEHTITEEEPVDDGKASDGDELPVETDEAPLKDEEKDKKHHKKESSKESET